MYRVGLVLVFACSAWNPNAVAENLTRMEWKVDGTIREALVYTPAAARKVSSPVVFAFHGHGGTMRYAAANFAYHKYWPAAIVVYMQGLNTAGTLTDPEGKRPGWQRTFGDQNDRDLKFFDAVLATLQKDLRSIRNGCTPLGTPMVALHLLALGCSGRRICGRGTMWGGGQT